MSVCLWLSIAVLLVGCSEPEVVPSEPKRADDALTSAEIESFLSVVDSLPDRKLPPLPSVVLAAPQWNRNRSLPIYELVKEEETSRVDRWSIDWLAAPDESDAEGLHYAATGTAHFRGLRIARWFYYAAWFRGHRKR